MRKPAWGLALNVTVSQDELVTKILHQARLLSPLLVEVGFMMEKLVPWSHGSHRNHKVGVIRVSGQFVWLPWWPNHNLGQVLRACHCIQSLFHVPWTAFLVFWRETGYLTGCQCLWFLNVFPLLMGLAEKTSGRVLQSHSIPVRAVRRRQEVFSAGDSGKCLWGPGRWLRRGGLGDPKGLARTQPKHSRGRTVHPLIIWPTLLILIDVANSPEKNLH